GITLGSLSLRPKRLSSTATANVITIQTKRIYPTLSRQASGGGGGGVTDVKELRNSRSTSEGGQFKVELLRNRRIVPCPWNALAVFLFYKWHVLNEPPPDFSNPTWADEPLFQGGEALSDVHLLDFCGEHYREYQRAFEHGKQTYKCISQRTFAAMESALTTSRMLRGAVSSSKTLYATQRALQNGVYDDMLVSIAGFSTDSRAQPYHIARQHCVSFAEYEESIFPFADYLPSYSETSHNGVEMNQRQAIIGFCNMLKSLRTVLLQDAALMLYTPFYRQMLKHNSVFGLSVFMSDRFRDKAETAGEALMTAECMPMYGSIPRDIRLGKVLPALRYKPVRTPDCTESSKDVGRRRQSPQRQASESVITLPHSESDVAERPTSCESSEDASSLRAARLRELNEMLRQSPGQTGIASGPFVGNGSSQNVKTRRESRLRELNEMLRQSPGQTGIASGPFVGNGSNQNAKTRRESRLRELNAQLDEASEQVNIIVEQPANEVSSQEAKSRRLSRLRELDGQLGESPSAKRRRADNDATPSTKLECALVPEPRLARSQRNISSGPQRRISVMSPSTSIYLIEDEDGNFIDMPMGNIAFIEPLDSEQSSAEAAAISDERST
ncbi:hypothetical protein GGI24_005092, partial [Coemansia furcata]